ncbi:CRISPR-associated protein Cas5 family [Pyrococcus yayanosii CH1]|uniref:CRISPR-associated protein Cas5 family n=1 Tax=Pyrococcus yayanosii (strain CH1 / JCM 16557) TaxID=529709 RepID=F8AJ43_PYRYC|nr:CRISPR-associated protein Cas5 family [Pyrococcus yayanosii CH1]
MVFFLKVEVNPTGIIALRALPQSKMRNALRYIPPSTLIGAIAYPLFHIKGERKETLMERKNPKSAADTLRGIFLWTTIKMSGKSKAYGSILKINRLHRGSVESAITSLPFTVMYGERDYSMSIVYLLKEEAISASSYSLKDFERAAWGISRLGSRESVVSVESVESGRVEIHEADEARTSYAFPFTGKEVEGRGALQAVFDWRKGIGSYSNTSFIVMFYPEEEVTVRGALKVVSLDGEEVVL